MIRQAINRRRLIYCLAALLCVAGLFATGMYIYHSITMPLGGTTLLIDNDDTSDSVCVKLGADPTGWQALDMRYSMNPRPGRYVIEDGTPLVDAYRRIRSHQQTPLRLTVPELRFVGQYPARLSRELMADSAQIAAALSDTRLIDSLGFNVQTLPAMIIPNTYEVWWDISARNLVLRLHRGWRAYWNDERLRLASELGLTPVEVSTLASIVDSETANNAEKPTIAGLYINRLRKGMLLQSDPTVIYAIGDFTIRRVLGEYLTVDSPYNTYRYAGLPPGPIRVPSVAGLEAVLHYQRHNYLYMCAKEDFSGTHNFASTLSQHNANARRYINALNARGIKR